MAAGLALAMIAGSLCGTWLCLPDLGFRPVEHAEKFAPGAIVGALAGAVIWKMWEALDQWLARR